MARYCLDEAVSLLGIVVENALQETIEVTRGKQKERKPRYTLEMLLDPKFRLPREDGRGDMTTPVRGTGDGALQVDEVL